MSLRELDAEAGVFMQAVALRELSLVLMQRDAVGIDGQSDPCAWRWMERRRCVDCSAVIAAAVR